MVKHCCGSYIFWINLVLWILNQTTLLPLYSRNLKLHQPKFTMEEPYSMLQNAPTMEPTMLNTQEGTLRNWNQDPLLLHQHLLTPQMESTSQGSINNSTCSSSLQYHVLSLLEGIINEKHIEETLIQSKLLSSNVGSIAATATATYMPPSVLYFTIICSILFFLREML